MKAMPIRVAASTVGGWRGVLLFPVIALLGVLTGDAYTESKQVPITVNGQYSVFGFSQLPPADSDLTVTVTLTGDYDATTEYADVTIEGALTFRHQGSPIACSLKGGAMSVTVPASAINTDHRLSVEVQNSTAVTAGECVGGQIEVKVSYSSRELIMTTFTCASTFPGYDEDLALFFQIQNIGADPVGDFRVSFYYSLDPGVENLYLIGSMLVYGLNGGAASPNLELAGHLPREVRTGPGYIHYFVDSLEVVPEASEANNRGYRPITITGKPDLIVYGPDTPLLLVPGDPLALTCIVFNDGQTHSGPSQLNAYWSADEVITAADTYLGWKPIGEVDAKWWHNILGDTIDVIVPTNVPEGPGYLGFLVDTADVIDESDETNNYASFPVELRTPRPDFRLNAYTYPNVYFIWGYPDPLYFDLALTNTGEAPSGDCLIEIYYSTDPVKPQTLVGGYRFNALDPGEVSPTKRVEFPALATALQGIGYWFYVIDPDDQNDEVDETNNLLVGECEFYNPPAVGVSLFTRVVENADPGTPVTFLVRIANFGRTMNPAPMQLRILMSGDATPDVKDVVLASLTIPQIPAGDAYPPADELPLSILCTLPADMEAGDWYFGLQLYDEGSAPPATFRSSFHMPVLYPDTPRISDVILHDDPSGRQVELRIQDTWSMWTYRVDCFIPVGLEPWTWTPVPGAILDGVGPSAYLPWIDAGDAERDLDAIPTIFYRVAPVGPK